MRCLPHLCGGWGAPALGGRRGGWGCSRLGVCGFCLLVVIRFSPLGGCGWCWFQQFGFGSSWRLWPVSGGGFRNLPRHCVGHCAPALGGRRGGWGCSRLGVCGFCLLVVIRFSPLGGCGWCWFQQFWFAPLGVCGWCLGGGCGAYRAFALVIVPLPWVVGVVVGGVWAVGVWGWWCV